MRRIASLSVLATMFVGALQGVATPAEVSTLSIDAVTVGSSVTVSGTLALGTDATGATKLGTDGAGDVSPPGVGFDLGDAFVTPDLAAKRLTLALNVNDGMPVIDGIGPAAGYVWPIAFNSGDSNAWLAAGTYVSGWLPKTEKWFELCTTTSGSYTCGTAVPGTMSASKVTWTIPFNILGSASYGSTFDPGSAAPGTPGVIPWAVFSGGSTFDTVGVASYQIPGRVEVGIAPAGTAESSVQYSSSAAFNPATSSFTMAAPTPAAGSYTVFARSCFGNLDELTCVKSSQPLTI